MLNCYRAPREREAPPRARAHRAANALIVWAGQDSLLERHVAKAGLALCGDGRLVVVEGASRWLLVEQAERVNAEVLSFLGNARGA